MLAQPRGFCAGVIRAIDIVEHALERFGAPVYVRHEIVHNRHVADGSELVPAWVRDAAVVGITAGASTPQTLVDGVVDVLRALGATRVSVLPGVEENVAFRLPAELLRVRAEVARAA